MRSGEQQQLARMMIERVRVHGAHHAKVVGHLRSVRQIIRENHAALAVLLELARAGEHRRGRLDERELQVLRHRRRQRLAVPFLQLRLRIEQIHLARAAFHEQEDDVLRLGREMRLPRSERIRRFGSAAANPPSAIMPMPPPAFCRKERREAMRASSSGFMAIPSR